jgi:Sec-independent protein translocase protein TatA
MDGFGLPEAILVLVVIIVLCGPARLARLWNATSAFTLRLINKQHTTTSGGQSASDAGKHDLR